MRTRALNGHAMAFLTVTGKIPLERRKGRTTPSRQWRNERVDFDLKDRWLEDLNSIPEIEIVSICGGHDIWRLPHIIFYPKKMYLEQEEKITEILNSFPIIWAARGMGNRGRMRICMAGILFAGTPIGDLWWSKAAGRIRAAIKRSEQAGE